MTATTEPAPKTAAERVAFFITPIGEANSGTRRQSDLVLDYILEPALIPDIVSRIDRSDRIADPRNITPGIIERIIEADLVIADLTGANPNVYYELAIAHAFERPVVHIATHGELPRFDVQDVRTFAYGIEVDQAVKAKETLREASALAVAQNRHSTFIGRVAQLKAVAESGDPVLTQLARLTESMQSLLYRPDRLVSSTHTITPQPIFNDSLIRLHDRALLAAKLLNIDGHDLSVLEEVFSPEANAGQMYIWAHLFVQFLRANPGLLKDIGLTDEVLDIQEMRMSTVLVVKEDLNLRLLVQWSLATYALIENVGWRFEAPSPPLILQKPPV